MMSLKTSTPPTTLPASSRRSITFVRQFRSWPSLVRYHMGRPTRSCPVCMARVMGQEYSHSEVCVMLLQRASATSPSE